MARRVGGRGVKGRDGRRSRGRRTKIVPPAAGGRITRYSPAVALLLPPPRRPLPPSASALQCMVITQAGRGATGASQSAPGQNGGGRQDATGTRFGTGVSPRSCTCATPCHSSMIHVTKAAALGSTVLRPRGAGFFSSHVQWRTQNEGGEGAARAAVIRPGLCAAQRCSQSLTAAAAPLAGPSGQLPAFTGPRKRLRNCGISPWQCSRSIGASGPEC